MWHGQQGPWSRNPPQGPKESEAEPMLTRPPLCKLRVGSQEARRPCSSPKVNAKGGVAAGFVLTSKRTSWTPRARAQRWGAKWDTGSSSWTLGPRETPPPSTEGQRVSGNPPSGSRLDFISEGHPEIPTGPSVYLPWWPATT